jgi:putative transposase
VNQATTTLTRAVGAGCKLSMDGRGACRDKVFVERLWRSLKYERVYLKTYGSVSATRSDIADYLVQRTSRSFPFGAAYAG